MRIVDLQPRSMYYGTPVALIVTINEDGSENITPMSSSWSLRDRIVIGMGSASQTASNLLRRPEFTFNLVSADIWRQVDALSRLTGKSQVPAHKADEMHYERDKWSAAGLTRRPSGTIRPACIQECPLQMEAVAGQIHTVEDTPEGFALIEARVLRLWAQESILVPGTHAVDPSRWLPLIFSYQSYRSPTTELGRMGRQVRGDEMPQTRARSLPT